MKAGIKKISLKFLDSIQMGEVIDTFDHVLVGHVRGRAYSTVQLKQWVLEFGGKFSSNCCSFLPFLMDGSLFDFNGLSLYLGYYPSTGTLKWL